MAVSFECQTVVDAAVDVLFDLSLSIDAHLASMSESRERAVAGVTSGMIGVGERVTWKAKHFGMPFTMTSEIIELDRPHRFVDQQVKGPFRRFWHEHTFEPSPAWPVMIDRIEFEAPLGPLGRVAERLVLRSYLRKLIEQRNAFLKGAAEGVGS